MVRKRERENPCFICGHYHKYEEGEVCGICGHRLQEAGERNPLNGSVGGLSSSSSTSASSPSSSLLTSTSASSSSTYHHTPSVFSSEILPLFLYLGSYDNASRAELLKAQGISRILNMVPTCQNLYKNSFTYKTVKGDQNLPFDECVEFIEQSRLENARILVHCMSGQNRSPAVVIAYLMRYKGWRLSQSYQWVKNRRPCVNLSSAVGQQLQVYEAEVFGSDGPKSTMFPTETGVGFRFGYPTATPPLSTPFFSPSASFSSPVNLLSFSSSSGSMVPPSNFVFGATRQEQDVGSSNITAMDSTMDSS